MPAQYAIEALTAVARENAADPRPVAYAVAVGIYTGTGDAKLAAWYLVDSIVRTVPSYVPCFAELLPRLLLDHIPKGTSDRLKYKKLLKVCTCAAAVDCRRRMAVGGG